MTAKEYNQELCRKVDKALSFVRNLDHAVQKTDDYEAVMRQLRIIGWDEETEVMLRAAILLYKHLSKDLVRIGEQNSPKKNVPEENAVLQQMRELLMSLDPGNHLEPAFQGVFAVAERNIECERHDGLMSLLDEAEDTRGLQERVIAAQKAELDTLKEVKCALPGEVPEWLVGSLTEFFEDAECELKEAMSTSASEMAQYAFDPEGKAFQRAVREYREEEAKWRVIRDYRDQLAKQDK